MAYMELSDGTSSISFAPLVKPGIRRPDARNRGVIQYDNGMRQYWDADGGLDDRFSLNNISKADADKFNAWWQDLSILEFRKDLDGDSATFEYVRLSPAGTRPFQFTYGQTVDTLFEAAVAIIETSSSSSA